MTRACIAIVDAARARIYTYEQGNDPTADPTDQTFHEELDLVNPGRRGHDLFSTTKSGPKHPGPGSGTTDDHRDGHFHELEHRFAQQVLTEVERIASERGFGHVIVVAAPKMLGELRKVDNDLRRPELTLDYVERDLAGLTSPQIHDHLARLNLIEQRVRPAFASR